MRDVEIEFMDLYKRVDRICRDMLRNEHYYKENGEEVFGVGAYIAAMKDVERSLRFRPAGWDAAYRTLTRFRFIRNQISHNVECSDCEESDLNDLQGFYHQLMTQTDALALAYRRNADNEREKPSVRIPQIRPAAQTVRKKQGTEAFGRRLAVFLVLAIVFLLVFLLFRSIR